MSLSLLRDFREKRSIITESTRAHTHTHKTKMGRNKVKISMVFVVKREVLEKLYADFVFCIPIILYNLGKAIRVYEKTSNNEVEQLLEKAENG